MSDRRPGFWREAFALRGSATPHVLADVAIFGVIAAAVCALAWWIERQFGLYVGIEVAPYEIAGAALGLLLVLRTNAGYDRWWEARILWGGIVNQSRNVAISALAYGPDDPQWRDEIVRWAAAFSHVCRCSLRDQGPGPELTELLGPDRVAMLAETVHMPSRVAFEISRLLDEGCERFGMDRFAFRQIDAEKARLIDHLGGCERILRTPLARVYSIKIRRFIALFLVAMPFALIHRLEVTWMIPLITMLVAYPLISLDHIGDELQNPFSTENLSHLPLNDIAETITHNVTGLLREETPASSRT
ncbi:MAG: hypothetical protein KDA44_19580 [Planctomycetales bacterium]|nr:hypothetical protein [Planctomycetales bacterium]